MTIYNDCYDTTVGSAVPTKPIEIAKDDSVGFRTGSTTYRALALADGELVDKAAFVRMNKATV